MALAYVKHRRSNDHILEQCDCGNLLLSLVMTESGV